MNQRERLLLKRLEMIVDKPGISNFRLYMDTVPSAKGRKKSIGTWSWTVPTTLQRRGLVVRRPVGTWVDSLDRVWSRYGLFITPAGEEKMREMQKTG